MNAFELGRDMSQRNGFLAQVPTSAEMLRELGGYYTAHSGGKMVLFTLTGRLICVVFTLFMQYQRNAQCELVIPIHSYGYYAILFYSLLFCTSFPYI